MNALGFVFSLLAILSFGVFASLSKQVHAQRLRSSSLGHLHANRKILNNLESEFYNSLQHIPQPKGSEQSTPANPIQSSPPSPPLVNPGCARINLAQLLVQDSPDSLVLHDAAIEILKSFYGRVFTAAKTIDECRFLEELLVKIRQQLMKKESFALEKLSFKDPALQSIYYKLLKGTKKADCWSGVGLPSFLDYFKVEQATSKVCLFHAHPNLLYALLGPKPAAELYKAMHTPKAPPITPEIVERICQETHAPSLHPNLFAYLELSPQPHEDRLKMTLLGEDPDTKTVLRKTVTRGKFQ